MRKGIRLRDLLDRTALETKLTSLLEEKNFYLKNFLRKETFELSQILETYLEIGQKLKPYLGSPQEILFKAFENKEKVIFEGAQGALLDLDYGTYPYVTSSNTASAAACVSSGIGPQYIHGVLGIVKAYTTRVGTGYFPTELKNEIGDFLQKEGAEFGTTTGRKRRCGWLDLVILNHAKLTNGLTHLAITKLDVLNKMDEIQVCTGYKWKGKIFSNLYENIDELMTEGTPVYKSLKGWKTDLAQAKEFGDLPQQAQDYLNFMQDFLEVPIAFISISPERSSIITTATGKAYLN